MVRVRVVVDAAPTAAIEARAADAVARVTQFSVVAAVVAAPAVSGIVVDVAATAVAVVEAGAAGTAPPHALTCKHGVAVVATATAMVEIRVRIHAAAVAGDAAAVGTGTGTPEAGGGARARVTAISTVIRVGGGIDAAAVTGPLSGGTPAAALIAELTITRAVGVGQTTNTGVLVRIAVGGRAAAAAVVHTLDTETLVGEADGPGLGRAVGVTDALHARTDVLVAVGIGGGAFALVVAALGALEDEGIARQLGRAAVGVPDALHAATGSGVAVWPRAATAAVVHTFDTFHAGRVASRAVAVRTVGAAEALHAVARVEITVGCGSGAVAR